MEKGKKIFYILTTILELLLFIGVYMVNYFTQSKMGMMRHVAHKNYVWEEAYPMTNILYGTTLCLIILMLIVLVLYMKRRAKLKKIVTIMTITMVIVLVSFTGFVLIYSTEKMRAFYYVSFILGIMTLLQIIKTFIGVVWYKN